MGEVHPRQWRPLHTECVFKLFAQKFLKCWLGIFTQNANSDAFFAASSNFPNFTLRTTASSNPSQLLCGMDVFLVTTTSRTLAGKFFICVSQHQALFDKWDTFFKDNIWENIADELDNLLFCLLRWSVKLSQRQPLLRPEPAVFQLFYEVRLFVSVPKTLAVSCQNFFVNSFSCVSVSNSCSDGVKSFDTNISHPTISHFRVISSFRIQCVKAFRLQSIYQIQLNQGFVGAGRLIYFWASSWTPSWSTPSHSLCREIMSELDLHNNILICTLQ